MYGEALAGVEGVRPPQVSPNVAMSWFVYVVQLAPVFTKLQRDGVIEFMRGRGIQCGNYFPGIHLEPFYRANFGYREGDFPVTDSVAGRTVALPFYPAMTEAEVEDVAGNLKDALAAV
jgi:perosamine synthetase